MSTTQYTNKRQNSKGPYLCRTSLFTLCNHAMQLSSSLQTKMTYDSELGYPNRVAEKLLATFGMALDTLRGFTNFLNETTKNQNMNLGIKYITCSSPYVQIPLKACKVLFNNDGSEYENPDFDPDFQHTFYDRSVGDGSSLNTAYFNNIMRVITYRFNKLKKYAFPEGTKCDVNNPQFKERYTDDQGNDVYDVIGYSTLNTGNSDADMQYNSDGKQQSVLLATFTVNFLRSVDGINFHQLSQELLTLSRSESEYQEYREASKKFKQDNNASRLNTALNSISKNTSSEVERFKTMTVSKPAPPPQTNYWKNRSNKAPPPSPQNLEEEQMQHQEPLQGKTTYYNPKQYRNRQNGTR